MEFIKDVLIIQVYQVKDLLFAVQAIVVMFTKCNVGLCRTVYQEREEDRTACNEGEESKRVSPRNR